MSDKEIIYVADPMCSWCWGFSPVLAKIRQVAKDKVTVSLLVGGLRAGETNELDDRMKEYIRRHWVEVNKRSGQPFSFEFFERTGFVYNTEPACRAVVTARHFDTQKQFEFFERVQRAFYAENRDVTGLSVLVDAAAECHLDADIFKQTFRSAKMVDETMRDFQRARMLGITGFPSVVLRNGENLGLLTAGYQSFETLAPVLHDWIET